MPKIILRKLFPIETEEKNNNNGSQEEMGKTVHELKKSLSEWKWELSVPICMRVRGFCATPF